MGLRPEVAIVHKAIRQSHPSYCTRLLKPGFT